MLKCLSAEFGKRDGMKDTQRWPAWWKIVQAELDARGWSLRELGRISGVDASLFSKYKRGVRPEREKTRAIAEALGIDHQRLEEALGNAVGVNVTLATAIAEALAGVPPERQAEALRLIAQAAEDPVLWGRLLETIDRHKK